MIVDEFLTNTNCRRFSLEGFSVQATHGAGTATITLSENGSKWSDAATGNGPVDAAYAALKRLTKLEPILTSYRVQAVSHRSDAIGEAHITLALGEISAQGRGASTDVIEASIKAYVNAINRLHQVAASKGVTIDGNDLGPGDPVQEVR